MAGYDSTKGLVSVQKANTTTWVKIPLDYMKVEEYKITPDQMLDLDSYRNEQGVLLRNCLDHKVTKIEFTTPPIYNTALNALLKIISDGYTNTKSHRLKIRYYDMYTDDYKEGTVYCPDIDFNINHVDEAKKIILYNPVRIAFIEY